MIACLPMYDPPHLRGATDRLWVALRDAIRAEGLDAPEALTRTTDPWPAWESPDLLVAQTCGLPFRSRLHERVTLVGTPDYGLPDTPPGHYHSVVVVRAGDPRGALEAFAGAHLAYNDPLSQSGWAAAAGLPIPLRPTLRTGAHARSARAVADGRAEIAALDAVTWRLLEAPDPVTRRLRVVARTPPTPGLPLVTACHAQAPALFRAVAAGIAALDPVTKAALGITGLAQIPAESYLSLPIPPSPEAVAAKTG